MQRSCVRGRVSVESGDESRLIDELQFLESDVNLSLVIDPFIAFVMAGHS